MGPRPNFHTPQPPQTKKWGNEKVFINFIWVLCRYVESSLGSESVIKWSLWLPLPTSLQLCTVFSFDHSIKSKTRPICVKNLIPLHYGNFQGFSWTNLSHVRKDIALWRMKGYSHQTWEVTSHILALQEVGQCYITTSFSCVRVKSFYLLSNSRFPGCEALSQGE